MRVIDRQFPLILLWGLSYPAIFIDNRALDLAAAGLLVLFILRAIPSQSMRTILITGTLGAIAVAVAAWQDRWIALLDGLVSASVFAAFFGAIGLLKAAAERRKDIRAVESNFLSLNVAARRGAYLLGSHVMGAVLVIGVMAIFAAVQGKEADHTMRLRAAEACQRGMCLGALWTPFWVAMAVVTEQLGNVPLWQIIAIGMPLAALATVMAQLMFGGGGAFRALGRATAALMPVVPAVAISAALVVCLTSFTSLGTLQALIIAVPTLCLISLLQSGRHMLPAAMSETYAGLGRVGAEIMLVTVAFCLGRVLGGAASDAGLTGILESLAMPPPVVIAAVLLVVIATAMIGIHQLLTISIILVLLAPADTGLSDAVLASTMLAGWALAAVIGLSSVATAAAGAMFGVTRDELVYGPNIRFAIAFAVLATVYYSLINLIPA